MDAVTGSRVLSQEEKNLIMEHQINTLTLRVETLTTVVTSLQDSHEDLKGDIKGLVEAWKSSGWLLKAINLLGRLGLLLAALYALVRFGVPPPKG